MTKTLKELELKHPEWCFVCGAYFTGSAEHQLYCVERRSWDDPMIAALTAAKLEDEATIKEKDARIAELERKFNERVEREDQLSGHAVAFWLKHGLGSKIQTSCFMCGKVGKPSITHLELPDIYICEGCAATKEELRKADETIQQQARELEEARQALGGAIAWMEVMEIPHSEPDYMRAVAAFKGHSARAQQESEAKKEE